MAEAGNSYRILVSASNGRILRSRLIVATKASFLWRGFSAVRRFATPVTNQTSIGRSVMSKDIASNKWSSLKYDFVGGLFDGEEAYG